LDGARIASGSRDSTVRVWDALRGNQLVMLEGHSYSVLSVAFSPDGFHIVSGSQDTTARVWDSRTGKLLAVAEGHDDCVWSVAFSPDGAYIVSGSMDRTVRVWDARTGNQVSILKGHKKRVLSVAFSPDGAHIVSGSLDMTVRVWEPRTRKQLFVFKGHHGRISSVAFSSDGKYVISCDHQGNKLGWNVESTFYVFSHCQDHFCLLTCCRSVYWQIRPATQFAYCRASTLPHWGLQVGQRDWLDILAATLTWLLAAVSLLVAAGASRRTVRVAWHHGRSWGTTWCGHHLGFLRRYLNVERFGRAVQIASSR
jgi:WD40 repeat protein